MAITGTAFVRVKLISDNLTKDLRDSVESAFDNANLDKIGEEAGDRIGKNIASNISEAVADHKVTVNADADTAKARAELHDLTGDKTVTIDPDLQSKEVSAGLAWLTRMRKVMIKAVLDGKSISVVEATLARITGINLFQKWGTSLRTLLTNLDTMAPKIGLIATGVTGVVGLAGSLVGWLGIVAAQLVTISSLALVLPGAFAGALLPLMAIMVALKDKTARGNLKGIGEQFSNLASQMSSAFWEEALQPLVDLTTTVMPTLTSGMVGVSAATGAWFTALTGVFGTATGLAELNTIFNNVAQGTRDSAGGVSVFTEGLLKLTAAGTTYLPQIAGWFDTIATRFNNWISAAVDSGEFNTWVSDALSLVKSLGGAVGDVGGILVGLGRAAEAAGGGGIFTLAKMLDSLHGAIDSVAGQQALTSFFAASDAAAMAVGSGISNLAGGLSSFLPTLNSAMVTAGGAIASIATMLGNIFSNPAFQTGFGQLISGTASALSSLSTAAGPLGDILGAVLGTVGTFLAAIGPSLAAAITALAPVFTEAASALQPFITGFGSFLTTAIQAVTPLISGLAPIIGNLLPPLLAVAAGTKTLSTASSIFSGLAGAITKINPANITKLASSVTGLNKLKDSFNAVKTAVSSFAPIVSKLAPIFSKLTPVFSKIVGLFPMLVSGIRAVGAAMAANPIGAIITVVALLVGVIITLWNTNEGFRNAVISVWEAIKGAFQAVGDWVTGTLVPAFIGAWNSIVGGLQTAWDAIKGFASWLGGVFSTAWDGIVSVVSGVWTNIVTAVQNGWNNITSFFSTAFAILGAVFSGIFNIIAAPFIAVFETVKAIIAAAFLFIVGIFTGNGQLIHDTMQGLMTRIGEIWTNMVNTVVTIVVGLWTLVTGFFTAAWTNIVTIVSAIWTDITTWFTTGVANVVAFMTALPGQILAAIVGLIDMIGTWASDTWNTVSNGFMDGVNAVVSFVSGLPGQVVSAISGLIGQIQSWADGVWDSVRSAFVNGVNNAVSAVSELPGRVVSAISGLGGQLVSVGSNIINGLVTGIKNAAGAVVSAATGVVQDAISAAKSVLGIASPSKVFKSIGLNLGKGFALGILASADTVRDASKRMVGAVAQVYAQTDILPRFPAMPALAMADGGLVSATSGGVLAMLAEAGKSERVEPLDSSGLSVRDRAIINQLAGKSGGGDTYVLNDGAITVSVKDLLEFQQLSDFLGTLRVQMRKK